MPDTPTSVELFAGAGGAAVGLHRAGFRSLLAVEWDKNAHATLAASGMSERAVCGDVRVKSLYDGLEGLVDLLWASPPCQAWSMTGNRLGAADERNGWPWTFDVVDRLRPRWVICENVRGMSGHKASCPVAAGRLVITEQVADIVDLFGEDTSVARGYSVLDPDECPGCYWEHKVVREFKGRYPYVSYRILSSADYGVPQRRERLFIVSGPVPYLWPAQSHSLAELRVAKGSGVYWRGRSLPIPTFAAEEDFGVSDDPEAEVGSITVLPAGPTAPWITARDALAMIRSDTEARYWLTPAQIERTARFIGRCRGWEPENVRLDIDLDLPAPTVTCARAAGKVNDAIILVEDGRLRYMTLAEAAAFQMFPPDHPWQGSRLARAKQIGNAVPPLMAETLGGAILDSR